MGIDISMDEVLADSGKGVAGRPHIAKVLLDKGHVGSIDEAFDRYIGKNGRAFVDKFCLPAHEAISVVKKAGGIPVIAHPNSLSLDNHALFDFLKLLKEMGLVGIEALYPSHTPAFTKLCQEYAKKATFTKPGGIMAYV